MEANPASFSRFGFENKSRKQEDMITEARAELFKIDAALQERRRKIDNFMKFISTEKDNILGNEVMVSAETAKNEIIGLENNRIQVESRLHKLAEKSPPISEVARAFGMLAKALSVATPSNKHELLTSVIRKIILRRIAVSSFKGSLFNKKRTFQLAIEFRTDGILNFGESDISLAVKRIGFSNIELKVTLEISSNRKEQKVLLMEAGYSTVSSVFGTPVASVPVPTLPNSENPIQRALRWQFLTENESKTASAVAIDEKVSKGLISQHIALLDLPQIIIDFMKSGRDHGMQKGFSLRELQRLLSMPTTEAIAQFHARIAGHPVQDIMPLS